MKKRLITILSLIMAFVLCFSLAACGGDNGGSKGKNPTQSGKTVSISLSDAIDALNGVLNADGFTGTASYTTSTKNTQALTQTAALDKRGNKIKVTAGGDESIIDLQTGYVYYKGETGYTFDNEFYSNAIGYVQYVLAALKQEVGDRKVEVRYDQKANTVTYTVEKAADVNKYIQPLQNAYKKKKTVGSLLNDYCTLLFDKSFDSMYKELEEYVKNPENTVGTLLDDLKEMGVDVEAILEMFGYGLPADQMTAVKARPLNKLVAGAYGYIMQNIGSLLPLAEDDEDGYGYEEGGNGMEALGMGLLEAMLFDEVSDAEITAGIQGLSLMVVMLKAAKVNEVIDNYLASDENAADLYTVIKDGVQLKNATMTLTLKADDDKNIVGVGVDCLVSHNYKGNAAEGSVLADNDYRATAQIVIDEYNTPTADFVINFDPDCDYKTSVQALIYDVTDNDVSVYFETGGKTVNVSGYTLFWNTPDGDSRQILPEDEDAFRFDVATSSFVFDNGLIQSAFSDEALAVYINAGYSVFGISLEAIVFFDDDDSYGYAITLTYVNDDLQEIYDYVYETAMGLIMGGGADAPNIGVYGYNA